MGKVYLIYKNDGIDIVSTWDECKKQTHGIKGRKFKSFSDKDTDSIIKWFLEHIDKESTEIKNQRIDELRKLFSDKKIELIVEGVSVEKKDLNELEVYLEDLYKNPNNFIAFVDGSYSPSTSEYSYGFCIVNSNKVILENSKKYKDLNEMRQINGELKAAILSCNFAMENNLKKFFIAYDYIGIKTFANQSWNPTNATTQFYADYMKKVMNKIDITFIKIPAHTKFKNNYNDHADFLAKKVLNLV